MLVELPLAHFVDSGVLRRGTRLAFMLGRQEGSGSVFGTTHESYTRVLELELVLVLVGVRGVQQPHERLKRKCFCILCAAIKKS